MTPRTLTGHWWDSTENMALRQQTTSNYLMSRGQNQLQNHRKPIMTKPKPGTERRLRARGVALNGPRRLLWRALWAAIPHLPIQRHHQHQQGDRPSLRTLRTTREHQRHLCYSRDPERLPVRHHRQEPHLAAHAYHRRHITGRYIMVVMMRRRCAHLLDSTCITSVRW